MTEGGILEPDNSQSSPPSARPPIANSNGIDTPEYHIMGRPGLGTSGRHISLLVNHLKVSIDPLYDTCYQYNVRITYGESKVVKSKTLRLKIVDKLSQDHSSEFNGKSFIFDGMECLYTVGPLPQGITEFTVILAESYSCENPGEPMKKSKHSLEPRLFKVEINYSENFRLLSPMQVPEGQKACASQESLRVLNTILKKLAMNRGCLLVGQSHFKDDSRDFFEVGGGVTGIRGIHSSFHLTKAGLSLNLDVAMTLIVTPGPVLDFLLINQAVKEPRHIDWAKAKETLKDLRIKTTHTHREFKIIGLSERPCYQQIFPLKTKADAESKEEQVVDTTVLNYFCKHRGVELTYSKYMPCLDVGKPDHPIYLPIELCSLVSLQCHNKDLTPAQQMSFFEKNKLKPHDRMKVLTDAVTNQYGNEPMLKACRISLEDQFMQVTGRVLEAPKLKMGRSEVYSPSNGRWTFKNKQFLQPVKIDCWAIVNFSFSCDTSHLSRELIKCGMSKGMIIDRPYALVEENQVMRKGSPMERVDAMFEKLQDKLPGEPEFILCVLPERKTSDLYGPWKMRSLTNFGIVTQCVCPVKITDQYLTNVLLKVNAKLGGINSLLAMEKPSSVPRVQDTPTMIVGMDVSHGPPGQPDHPSIAAVVGSLSWPLISRYRASIRTQSSRMEIIDSLFKPSENGDDDDGIMRELLKDFFVTSNGQKPKQIIIFRDGVSESQFNQVLNIELEQIKKAYLKMGESQPPKFTVIIAQKKHHTRLFEVGSASNVPAGTIVDTEVVHPKNYDFYICAHAGVNGTLRPVHYHVLLDEIGFSVDELQNLIHSLCYVYQRSTHATSLVAPISYAHHAARQVGQFLKSQLNTEQNITSTGSIPVTELPRLHENVQDSMFFC